MFESGPLFRVRLIACLLALTVAAGPLAADTSCFDRCHEIAMSIYDGDTDFDDPDWQFANSWFHMCLDSCG